MPGRGLRHPGLPAAVLRAGRRGPGRGRLPDPEAAGRGAGLTSSRPRTTACGPAPPGEPARFVRASKTTYRGKRYRDAPDVRQDPADGARDVTSLSCRRPTCTCTSPARCGPRPCSSWPTSTASTCPTALTSRRAAAAAGHRRAGLVPLPAALRRRPVLPARARGHPPAGARGRRGGRRATARAGWRSRSTRPSYAPRLGGLIPALELILDAVRRGVAGDRARHARCWSPRTG